MELVCELHIGFKWIKPLYLQVVGQNDPTQIIP